jgi:hypothetical protein
MATADQRRLCLGEVLRHQPHTMRQTFHALLLVFIIELLWVRLDSFGAYSPGAWQYVDTSVCAGFPLRAVSFTFHQGVGNVPQFRSFPAPFMSAWTPVPGFTVYPSCQALAAFSAMVLFFGLRWLLNFELARRISHGVAVGVVFGILTSLATRASTRIETGDPVNWFNGFLTIIALPSAICFLSQRSRSWRYPLLLLVVIVAVFPWASFWCDQFKPQYRYVLGAGGRRILEPSIDAILTSLFVGCMVGVFVFLIRRFLPIFKRYEAAD